MAKIGIPGLYRKFRLMIDYGHAADWTALAGIFGVSPSTLKWWGHGGGLRQADLLPSKHRDAFFKLVGTAIGAEVESDAVREIAFSPASSLENALRSREAAFMGAMLEAEADRDAIRLILKVGQTGLVETDLDRPAGSAVDIPLNAYFRLECDTATPVRFVTALQRAQRSWGFVPAATDAAGRQILLPGYLDNGSPAFMRERNQRGHHRFIVLQTPQAIPAVIQEYAKAEVALDYATLNGLVTFYQSQPLDTRRCYLIDLMIGSPDDRA